jgi:quaternary ammonium compound-resistance protein SugE
MSPWPILILAGLFEIAWATTLKSTQGFTRLGPSVATIALMAVSFLLLARAMRDLPAGTAYAVWTGIGAVGVAITGVVLRGEPATLARLLCIALIAAGIVGLKILSPAAPPSS